MITEVDNQKMLYVVFDGNNMKQGFRAKIIEAVNEAYPEIDMIEVMTTDTHLVNTISGGGLTVGAKHQELLTTITSIVSVTKLLAPLIFIVAAIMTILWIF